MRSTHTLAEVLPQAASTIRANPLRASLAAFAMAAAVAATAIIVTGLESLAATARQTSVRAFGSDTFVIARVFGAGLSRKALAEKLNRNPSVTKSDLRFLERWTGSDVLYSAIAQHQGDVSAGSKTFERASIGGVSSTLADIRDIGLSEGRFFVRQEQQAGVAVAVIGADVAAELFPDRDPLGSTVRISGRAFRVIGVQGRQGTAGGASLDRYVWIPYETYTRLFGIPAGLQLFARAIGPLNASQGEDRARTGMRARRQLQPGVPDTFDILAPQAARSFVESISERAGSAGPPISAMALIAAIIVVANTTLVSVTQRTRELGVRRAVGASRRQILLEVLAESSLIAVLGGVAGLMVAKLVLMVAAQALGVALSLTISTAILALLAALLSGLLAGLYPARRASRVEIVNALHAE